MMTLRTLTATHHDTSLTTLPSLDKYRRKTPEYESERSENENEKKHKINNALNNLNDPKILLKHVKTKEPIGMASIMKNEHEYFIKNMDNEIKKILRMHDENIKILENFDVIMKTQLNFM